MSEIPDRIMDEARKIASSAFEGDTLSCDLLTGLIAKALNAEHLAAEQRGREMEREECAAICDAGVKASEEMGTLGPVEKLAQRAITGCSSQLAALIRSRKEG